MLNQIIDPGDLRRPPPLDSALSVRLTSEERKALDRAARAAGVSPGRLLRAVLRGALRNGLAGAGRPMAAVR